MEKTNYSSYWTEEQVLNIAKQYKTRSEFAQKCRVGYDRAKKLGILDKCTWGNKKKPNNYWTKEHILEVAKQYKTKKDFQKYSKYAYNKALSLNILVECTWFVPTKEIMSEKLTKWDKDTILEVAKKYNSRKEFSKGCGGAYSKALELGILDKCTWFKTRTEILSEKLTKWDENTILEVAKKYVYLCDFKNENGGAYSKALELGILDKCTWLKRKSNPYEDKSDVIYVYELPEYNTAYVGRTIDIVRRHKQHQTTQNDSVYKFCQTHKILLPDMKILECNLTPDEGSKKEKEYIKKYEKKGWKLINIATGGSLGALGSAKWSKEKILEVAKQYKTRSEFGQKCPGAYNRARKLGILDKCTWFEGNKKWTYETCYQEAKKYNSRWEFGKKNSRAYQLARKNGWLDIWFSVSKTGKKWTYETCCQEAKKYNSRKEFEKGCGSAYKVALKNGWLDEFFPKTKNI